MRRRSCLGQRVAAGDRDASPLHRGDASLGIRATRRFADKIGRAVERTARRAGIYCRVSTPKEEQRKALKASEERLRRYVADRGWALERVWLDTASGATGERPDYKELKAAARARVIDVIVTTRLDRLARSVRELVNFVAELEALGVDLVLTEQQIDTTTPGGRLLFHVMAAVAEFEREIIRERVLRGLDSARAKGKKLGRPSKAIDLEEARRLRAEGWTYEAIAARIAKTTAAVDGKATRVSASWLCRRLCKIPTAG